MMMGLILFSIGFISGIIGGMGIGGGTILIPALIIFAKTEQHIAQSVNLIYFIPTAIIALVVHIKNKRIDFKTALPIIISGIVGALAGSSLAASFSSNLLRKMFAFFLLIMGIYEMFRKPGDEAADVDEST
ncbi:MAG TPA: sulfite exporter TauE/SafE family protein [Clostridiales bacterium]|nr:sulfite exporter TauE/SafE family protein [Clostridiales bacterium]